MAFSYDITIKLGHYHTSIIFCGLNLVKQRGRRMVKRKLDGAVDESSADQETDTIVHNL